MNEMLQKEEQYARWEDLDVSFECSDVMNSTTISNSTTNQSANRSGLVQSTKSVTTVGVQMEPVKPDKPKLRVKRKICTDKSVALLRIKQKGLKIMLRSFSKTTRLGVDHVLHVKIY